MSLVLEFSDVMQIPIILLMHLNHVFHHGKCSNKNECLCDLGYEKKPGLEICEPICETCIGAICVAPNKCKCIEGFKETDDNTICERLCVPPCNDGICHHGTCTTCPPNNRVDDRNTCVEVCNPECMNGNCQEQKCLCQEGFEFELNSTNICVETSQIAKLYINNFPFFFNLFDYLTQQILAFYRSNGFNDAESIQFSMVYLIPVTIIFIAVVAYFGQKTFKIIMNKRNSKQSDLQTPFIWNQNDDFGDEAREVSFK